MMKSIRLSVAAALFATSMFSGAHAQVCGPAYTVQPQTVFETQLEERMKVVYDTVYVDQELVTTRLVPKTRTETRSYTVTKPVTETSTVQETYTVMRPVKRRKWIDRSYDETSYVTETAERDETYTSLRPVSETVMQTRNRVVQRPVTETRYQTQTYTTMRPETTYRTAVVDQGQYMVQNYYQPGDTRYGLRWMQRGYQYDANGQLAYRRGGLGWVPYTSAGQTYGQLQYQPNPVQVAVPQTTMRPEVHQAQVPYQVTRLQNEVVQEQVPVTSTRYEEVRETRKVPYAVRKPVTRRVNNIVPVDVVEYVEQKMVRPKTVTRTSYKMETVEKPVEVTYYEEEKVTSVVKVPRRVARYEPYTVEKVVARKVYTPVTLSYYDAYSTPLSQGISNWALQSALPGTSSNVTYGSAKPVVEDPKPEVQSITEEPFEGEGGESEGEAAEDGGASPSDGLDLSGSDGNEAPQT